VGHSTIQGLSHRKFLRGRALRLDSRCADTMRVREAAFDVHVSDKELSTFLNTRTFSFTNWNLIFGRGVGLENHKL